MTMQTSESAHEPRFGQGEAQAEAEAANAFMQISNEEELDHFLPMLIGPLLGGLKALAPMVLNAAMPVLKSIGTQALAGLAGGGQGEQHEWGHGWRHGWHHGWWGRPWGWRHHWHPPDPDPGEGQSEQENFLGLGNLIGSLFNELEGFEPERARHEVSMRFVRFARHAAKIAASDVLSHARSGGAVGWHAIRGIVFDALMNAGHRHHGHYGHYGHYRDYGHNGHYGHHHGHYAHHGDRDGHYRHHGHGDGHSGRWERHGSRIVLYI